jgi:hypothetical protein
LLGLRTVLGLDGEGDELALRPHLPPELGSVGSEGSRYVAGSSAPAFEGRLAAARK